MNELLNDNTFLIDLSNIESIPEIIYKLSSVLDKDEAKNKKVCLKLSDVNLTQAQLLSIKSLINGIGSTLVSINTMSLITEKTALSLGIVVSNYIQNSVNTKKEDCPSKFRDELEEYERNLGVVTSKSEHNTGGDDTMVGGETRLDTGLYKQADAKEINNAENIERQIETSNEKNPINKEINTIIEETSSEDNADGFQDELDVIFGSASSDIFEEKQTQEVYAQREELSDIIVEEQEYTKEDMEIEAFPTKYIKQTIRSGQVIDYDGNIVIIGDCHTGCEIHAHGDITIWGILSGIAHAGANGNEKAKIRALKMNAIQLRIADCYSRRPDSLNTILVDKTNSFIPEEARIVNGEIVVFKINS